MSSAKSRWRMPIAAAVLAAGAAPALAQSLGQASTVHIEWWRVIASFMLCSALAVGGALALRARLGLPMKVIGASQRRMKLLETLRLSHQVDLCLVSCDGRELMIAASPHGAVLLDPQPSLTRAPEAR